MNGTHAHLINVLLENFILARIVQIVHLSLIARGLDPLNPDGPAKSRTEAPLLDVLFGPLSSTGRLDDPQNPARKTCRDSGLEAQLQVPG